MAQACTRTLTHTHSASREIQHFLLDFQKHVWRGKLSRLFAKKSKIIWKHPFENSTKKRPRVFWQFFHLFFLLKAKPKHKDRSQMLTVALSGLCDSKVKIFLLLSICIFWYKHLSFFLYGKLCNIKINAERAKGNDFQWTALLFYGVGMTPHWAWCQVSSTTSWRKSKTTGEGRGGGQHRGTTEPVTWSSGNVKACTVTILSEMAHEESRGPSETIRHAQAEIPKLWAVPGRPFASQLEFSFSQSFRSAHELTCELTEGGERKSPRNASYFYLRVPFFKLKSTWV
jgi:hypothetical protein